MSNLLALGDPVLDADHEELHSLIESLADAPPEGAVDALNALKAHAMKHFSLEDEYLLEMKDGNASCHIDEHAAVLQSLSQVIELIRPEPGAARSQDMVRRLVSEFRRWLPEHVLEMDAGVATARTRKRLGGAPVVLNLKGRADRTWPG